MSANDKAAATYGRQPMSISQTADKLAAHRWGGTDANTLRAYCHCGWEANVLASGPAHRDHQAEMLEPLIVAREHEASRQALTNAAEVIDCRTNNTHNLNEHGWNGPLTGNGDTK